MRAAAQPSDAAVRADARPPQHRQEEDLVFPKLKERIDFPPKVSADHKELLKLMAHAATTFEGLGSSTGADECLAVVDEIEQLMLPHMHEEEVTVLPGMMQKCAPAPAARTPRLRSHSRACARRGRFLPAEIVKIEREMGKEFDWFDMPHFYRPFGTDIEKKRQHANRSFGKPGFVFDYFIAKDFERYDVEFGSLIDELKDPGRKEFNEEQRSMYYARRRQSAMCVPGHATVNPAHQEH